MSRKHPAAEERPLLCWKTARSLPIVRPLRNEATPGMPHHCPYDDR